MRFVLKLLRDPENRTDPSSYRQRRLESQPATVGSRTNWRFVRKLLWGPENRTDLRSSRQKRHESKEACLSHVQRTWHGTWQRHVPGTWRLGSQNNTFQERGRRDQGNHQLIKVMFQKQDVCSKNRETKLGCGRTSFKQNTANQTNNTTEQQHTAEIRGPLNISGREMTFRVSDRLQHLFQKQR